MNFNTINSFFTETSIFKQKNKFWIKNIPNILLNKSSKEISSILNAQHVTQLPFLIKIKLVKTVKKVIPTVSYHYTHPQHRQHRSNSYNQRIIKNKAASSISLHSMYSTLLKI